jgi:protein ImuA
MAGDARAIIEGLREEIRRLERKPPSSPACVPSGRAEVDALLAGGGFPRGALSQLAGGPASGKTAIALRVLARAMGERALGAYVDGRGELYPPAAAAFGVDLGRLLLVRPHAAAGEVAAAERARRALWAAEAVLGSGAFAAAVVDVDHDDLRRIGAAALDGMLRRVRAAAERGGCVGLWLAAPGVARVPGAVRLDLEAGGAGPAVRRAAGAAPPVTPQLALLPEVGHAA